MTDKNARIERTMLGVEDHGILTAYLHCVGDGWGQGFGGYGLDGPACAIFVRGVLDALEVERWERLPGTIVRLRYLGESGPGNSKIGALGHAYKDKWFMPDVAFAELRR